MTTTMTETKPAASEPALKVNGTAAQAADGAGTETAPVAPAEAPRETQASILGQVIWLMMQSPLHRHLFVSELEWRILPAISLGQLRLFRDKDRKPLAFVTWAFVTDEIVGRLQAQPARLQPSEWKSGERRLVIDVAAPFGGGEKFAAEVMKSQAGEARA
jgi:cytolysin-activating lysine-acyltransferase